MDFSRYGLNVGRNFMFHGKVFSLSRTLVPDSVAILTRLEGLKKPYQNKLTKKRYALTFCITIKGKHFFIISPIKKALTFSMSA